MATRISFESPYWIGWSAGSWGASWGYTEDGELIEVDEIQIVRGGGVYYSDSFAQSDKAAKRKKREQELLEEDDEVISLVSAFLRCISS